MIMTIEIMTIMIIMIFMATNGSSTNCDNIAIG